MICINKGKIKNLTIGKSYKVLKLVTGTHCDSGKGYAGAIVINDAGMQKYYSAKRFVQMDEWREIQLKELGI
jgi:hypothetical protein